MIESQQNKFKMLSKPNHYYPGGGWGRKKPDIMQNSVQLNLPTGTGTELGKSPIFFLMKCTFTTALNLI